MVHKTPGIVCQWTRFVSLPLPNNIVTMKNK